MPTIIYENSDFIVLNKPFGMPVHGDGKNEQSTVSDWILKNYPEIKDVGESAFYNGKDILRPGIVHRLDKDTTGAMIIAKTPEMYEHLKKQFQEHTILKVYHAVCYGSIKADTFFVDQAIGRSAGDIRKWATGNNARGTKRDAYTKFKVLGRLGVDDNKGSTEDGTYSYVECTPETGRTHQIRVHLKYANYPIVCDVLYAERRNPALGFSRLALHAQSIYFIGLDGEKFRVEAPYPEDFVQARIAFGL